MADGGVYYNEFDPQAARWLRELMADGLIPRGTVDERDIRDVAADDVRGFAQCHFFGGVGGWPRALRLAGWGDDRPIWTGSCPCPPFSSAGKKKRCPACGGRPVPHPLRTGFFVCVGCEHQWHADGRHLWPELLRLVRECRPPVAVGEQVAGADGVVWFAGVRASLELAGYAAGAADLAAAGVAAPHIRQRVFWLAVRRLGHPDEPRREGAERADAPGDQDPQGSDPCGQPTEPGGDFWSAFDLVPCRDGKRRRVPRNPQPGVQPLADGLPPELAAVWSACNGGHPLTQEKIPGRGGLLTGAGNAIVPPLAAVFIRVVVGLGSSQPTGEQ